MSTLQRRILMVSVAVIGILSLGSCTASPGAAPAPTSTTVPSDQRLEGAHAAPPSGRVIGAGTVLDVAGEVQLCLGAIMESYPPQCQGLPLDGWSWDGLEGTETSGDTTWGAFAVYGVYDGSRFMTDGAPIMLALYDPMRPDDPTGGREGTTPDAELTRIQDDIASQLGAEALSVHSERGYVWLQVVWDDGALQAAADAEYGEHVVIVTAALHKVD